MAAAIADELAVDPRSLSSAAMAERVVEFPSQLNRLEAAYLRSVEAFDRTGGADASFLGSTAAFLRATCRLSPSRAYRDVKLAHWADAAPLMSPTAP